MKRYTVVFQPIASVVVPSDLRDEVEQVLLRLHPRITYKMGQVTESAAGLMLVQIMVDGKRELFEKALEAKQWKLQVQFEDLSLGWMMENEDATLLASATTAINVDPLAGVEAGDETRDITLSKRRLWLRYIFMIVFTVVWIALLIANAFHTNSPVLEGIYIVSFAIWLISLNETPFDLRVYANKIALKHTGLEVTYWFRKMPIHVDWQDIWGLDYANSVCEVHNVAGRLRFLVSERFGCKEKKFVLKTIIKKADLLYVEGNSMVQKYRRAEAGNRS